MRKSAIRFYPIRLLLLTMAVAFLLTIHARAAQSDITVSGGSPGWDYTYEDHVLIILRSTPMTLSGITTTDRVYIAPGANANLTLDGLHIDLSAYVSYQGCAFDLAGSAAITLAEDSENTLRSGGRAGINVPQGASAVITSSGKLNVYGAENAAGIGGWDGKNGGNISITGGIVTAYGGRSAAGIGGGYNGNAGTITVSAGEIFAYGGKDGAGVGGGSGGDGGDIEVSGGTIRATGGSEGTGIGGGRSGNGGHIMIRNGEIYA